MGNCWAGAKQSTRKVEESVGLKGGKKSPNYDAELVTNRKIVMDSVKTLEKLIKIVEGSEKDWSTCTKIAAHYKTPAEKIDETLQNPDIHPQTLDTLVSIEEKVMAADRTSVQSAVSLVKSYCLDSKKTTDYDWKTYEDKRIEYDHYLDKMSKQKMDEAKQIRNEKKLEMDKQEFDRKHEHIKARFDQLLKVLPTVNEAAALAVVAAYGIHYKEFTATINKLGPMLEEHGVKLAVTQKELYDTAKAAVEQKHAAADQELDQPSVPAPEPALAPVAAPAPVVAETAAPVAAAAPPPPPPAPAAVAV